MYTFLPDYSNIDELFIVSPLFIGKENENKYWEEFINLIILINKIINKKITIVIVCSNDDSLQETNLRISEYSFNNLDIIYEKILISDIWIRDYFSCGNIKDEEGKLTTLKGIYAPSYNSYYSNIDDIAGHILSNKYFDNYKNLPFKLDGGNVICNEDFVIISDKLFTENIDICSKQDLLEYFRLNFSQKLITVPTEILDTIGHTDSICRFIDKNTIILPIYEEDYKIDNRYIMTIHNLLQSRLGIDYDIKFIPSFLSEDINEDNIFSARGLYINYLRLENNLIFPSFKGLEVFEEKIKQKLSYTGLNIYFTPFDTYSFQGGCLNCITNVKFK